MPSKDNLTHREDLFIAVFNNDKGKELLNDLDDTFKIRTPDTENPNDVYFRLGRQAAVNYIRNILEGAKK